MPTTTLDSVRETVLDRMERGDRVMRFGLIGAALAELAFLIFALLYVDWHAKVQVELLLFAVMGYTITALGLVALSGHVTRSVGRILAVLDSATR